MIHKQTVCHEGLIPAPASRVWALLVDWAAIVEWMPDGYIRNLRMEGEGRGAIRHLVTGRGVHISERLDDMDKDKGRLFLSIIEPLPWGILSYTAQAHVEQVEHLQCRLSWCGTFELPQPGSEAENLVFLLKKSYETMFRGISRELTGNKRIVINE